MGQLAYRFGRIDYQDRAKREALKTLETVVAASPSLVAQATVLAGAMRGCTGLMFSELHFSLGHVILYGPAGINDQYGPPVGFNWEWFDRADDLINNDPKITGYNLLLSHCTGYNVEAMIDKFVAAALEQIRSPHPLQLDVSQWRRSTTRTAKTVNAISCSQWGSDFHFGNARSWFKNLDKAEHYTHCEAGECNIMFTIGEDFNFGNARGWFKNLDKLLHYANLDGRVNAFYSTPEAYFKSKTESAYTWSVKTDDWLPYCDGAADYDEKTDKGNLRKIQRSAAEYDKDAEKVLDEGGHAYWTGYFTSRPALKRHVATLHRCCSILDSSKRACVCRQQEIFASWNELSSQQQAAKEQERVDSAGGAVGGAAGVGERAEPHAKSARCSAPDPDSGREASSAGLWLAVAVAQHHDTVSGTARQHVTDDYQRRLSVGASECDSLDSDALDAWHRQGSQALSNSPTPPRTLPDPSRTLPDSSDHGKAQRSPRESGREWGREGASGLAWSDTSFESGSVAGKLGDVPEAVSGFVVRLSVYNPLAQVLYMLAIAAELLRLPVPVRSSVSALDSNGGNLQVQVVPFDAARDVAIVQLSDIPAVGGLWVDLAVSKPTKAVFGTQSDAQFHSGQELIYSGTERGAGIEREPISEEGSSSHLKRTTDSNGSDTPFKPNPPLRLESDSLRLELERAADRRGAH
ncbi:hypothetical protein T492DRAFT_1150955 [Pavlovales sp. CCMP2436]|nr:hypothetical protein T492DRAFT_1150955 [Pavlovales sp. CCMP2436]